MEPIVTESTTAYPKAEAEKRLETLENQELDSPAGQLSAESYAEFLGMYLLTSDLVNAKLLWKRIPLAVKTANEQLKAVWEVGKATWKHEYAEIHSKVNAFEWEEPLKRIMAQYKTNTQSHVFDIVSGGYSSIKLSYLASILGLSESEVIEAVQKKGWEFIQETGIIKPVKTKKDATYSLKNEEHLEKLTQHVLFLET